MRLYRIYDGDAKERTPIVFLIPPVSNVVSWTHPTTGFLWTNAEVFWELHSSPTYVFDHDTQEYSQIQVASEYLLQQIARVRQNQNLRNRPILFIGHGIGGLVAKWSLVRAHNKEFHQLFVNTTIGIILMNTININTFKSWDQLLSSSSFYPTQTPELTPKLNQHGEILFQQFREVEKNFSSLARNFVVLSFFSPQKQDTFSLTEDIRREQTILGISNEAKYCSETAETSLYQYFGSDDPAFVELQGLAARMIALITKRSTSSVSAHRPSGWDTKTSQLQRTLFPLDREVPITSHLIRFFKGPRSTIITKIHPNQQSLKDFCNSYTEPSNWATKSEDRQEVRYVWHHAPANHTLWVECMMDSVLREDSSFPRSSLDSAWAESEQYAENVSLGSLFMNATCKLLGNKAGSYDKDSGSPGMLLLVPYIHWDTVQQITQRQTAVDLFSLNKAPASVKMAHQNAASDDETRFTSWSIISEQPLHLPLCLDQHKHPSVALPTGRLSAQSIPMQTQDTDSGAKSLVVHQLWIIILDKNTIVTFFPRKELESSCLEVSQIADLKESLLNNILATNHPEDVCSSVFELAALMVHQATTGLLSFTNHREFLFLDFYRQAVGDLRRHYISAFLSFSDQSSNKPQDQVEIEEHRELSLVLNATALKDELQGLSKIIDTQLVVVQDLGSIVLGGSWENPPPSSTSELQLKRTYTKLLDFKKAFDTLQLDVEAVESDFLRLLDLRQKRANLREARATLRQTEETANQTKTSALLAETQARQSEVMLIFTILTAVFLPMSFLASYYAMNTTDPSEFWEIAAPVSGVITITALVFVFRAKSVNINDIVPSQNDEKKASSHIFSHIFKQRKGPTASPQPT